MTAVLERLENLERDAATTPPNAHATRPGVPTTRAEAEELDRLGERICELAGHLAAATGSWLELVAEFDPRQGWGVDGVRSCAHWLSWRCGIGLVAAREHVRVARSLEEFPLIGAQLRSGRLSYSKVRALTRVACPETEANLVEIALSCTGAQLERLAAGMRRSQSLDEVNARHEARRLSWSWDEDGSLILRGRFSPEDGALIVATLDAARESAPHPGPASANDNDNDNDNDNAGIPKVTASQSRADALLRMAETLLASGPAPAPGGKRHQVDIHTDLEALLSGEGARIEDGPPLHPETLRRLTCDSAAAIIAHHANGAHGTSMDVGRRTRVIPTALRRALQLRDGGCRFPGCTERRFVDAHHVRHWSRGGGTDLSNLVLLCRYDHRLLHEGGYTLHASDQGFVFRRPDGTLIPEVPAQPTGDADAVTRAHTATITAETAWPDWYGDHLDLAYTVELLRRSENASAEAFSLN
ncbi:MAG: DUF222 domain-containing protein [Sporichthyaceae bacterium]